MDNKEMAKVLPAADRPRCSRWWFQNAQASKAEKRSTPVGKRRSKGRSRWRSLSAFLSLMFPVVGFGGVKCGEPMLAGARTRTMVLPPPTAISAVERWMQRLV